MENEENKKVYSVDELAELWDVPRRRVADLIRSGKLKAFKIGKMTYRITQEMLDEYVSANSVISNGK